MRKYIDIVNESIEWPSMSFIREMESLADRRDPRSSSTLLFKSGDDIIVSLTAFAVDERNVSIKEIKVAPYNRQQGGGTKVMKIVCDLADKYKVTLHGHAFPIRTMVDRKVMSQDDLQAWYGRYGFVEIKKAPQGGVFMSRNPKRS